MFNRDTDSILRLSYISIAWMLLNRIIALCK